MDERRSLVKRAVPNGIKMDRVGTIATGGCRHYATEMDDAYDESIQMAQGKFPSLRGVQARRYCVDHGQG